MQQYLLFIFITHCAVIDDVDPDEKKLLDIMYRYTEAWESLSEPLKEAHRRHERRIAHVESYDPQSAAIRPVRTAQCG